MAPKAGSQWGDGRRVAGGPATVAIRQQGAGEAGALPWRSGRAGRSDGGSIGNGTAVLYAGTAAMGLVGWEVLRFWLTGPVEAVATVVFGAAVVGGAWYVGGRRPRPASVGPAERPAVAGGPADRVAAAPGTETERRRLADPGGVNGRDVLVRVASRLAGATDLGLQLNLVADETARAVRAQAVVLFVRGRTRDELVAGGEHGMPESVRHLWPAMPVAHVESMFGGGRTVVLREGEAVEPFPDRALYATLGIRSAALVRMGPAGQLTGMLAVLSFDAAREFREDELTLLRGIADLASQAVSNARLLSRAERRLRLTQALRNIDIAIAGSMDLRVTLQVILEEVARQLRVDACDVLLLDEQAGVLSYAAGRGFRTSRIERRRLRLGEGRAGRAAYERQAIGPADLRGAVEDADRALWLEGEGFETYYALPLIAKGNVNGVLEVFQRGLLDPDEEWLEFAESLAGQAAIALDNARLFDEMQRLNASLTIAYDSTLEGWSRALDLRDRETEGHTRRVTDLTLRLARAMSFDPDELAHVRRGAILHDIGKMGIPDNILLKPGPLTEDEWSIMRRHPVLAYELLSPIPYLRPALEIPYCHHEKWNGTGYPRGLKGEQIPLAARIFAVADVWDALRSDRPYRAAWPAEKAWDYIQSLSGTHFDPDVVQLFDRVYHA